MPATILSDNGASSGTAGLKTSGSNDGQLALQTTTSGGAATTAITLDTVQNATFAKNIGLGGTAPTTSGTGITFPATQSASTDANTLDDYEEGTWTPSIGGTATYTSRTGTYRKIGSQVTCWFDVTINSVGTGSGALQNLPFTNNASVAGCGNVGYFASLVSSFVMINPIVPGNTTNITFETATAATDGVGDAQNIWKNSSRCTGFVTYHT